ncbi:hypothetical protein H9X96_03240 [Pedobacter sp. N36a]|uniref:hypothetical protein n=1 Tax=Pedobacter sp. N36a TaxID=2767996 RepID=UPI001656AD41|nr:hypothetical protein [Pedobacter sp. N36a]MBC8984785.1 hypothetical protein [Pedobacter sp. N36a]
MVSDCSGNGLHQEVSVEPALMIYRLQEFMQAKFEGYTLLCNSPVIDCTPTGNGVAVRVSGNRTYQANKAVLCNGYEFK